MCRARDAGLTGSAEMPDPGPECNCLPLLEVPSHRLMFTGRSASAAAIQLEKTPRSCIRLQATREALYLTHYPADRAPRVEHYRPRPLYPLFLAAGDCNSVSQVMFVYFARASEAGNVERLCLSERSRFPALVKVPVDSQAVNPNPAGTAGWVPDLGVARAGRFFPG